MQAQPLQPCSFPDCQDLIEGKRLFCPTHWKRLRKETQANLCEAMEISLACRRHPTRTLQRAVSLATKELS